MKKPTPETLALLGLSEAEWWFTCGRYIEARGDRTKLRVSIARIAQAMKLNREIPGSFTDEPAPLEQLTYAAETYSHGWNALCETIVEAIEAQRQAYEADIKAADRHYGRDE